MPLNTTDANAFCRTLLIAHDEDVQAVARSLRTMRVEYPTVDWIARLTAVAEAWQPFIERGLSIQWWVNEVARLSQS